MSDKKPESIPIKDLISEDGAHELATSPDTQPYLDEIAALPLEKRYVWRVASALKWAFADLETVSVAVDRQTLSQEDLPGLWFLTGPNEEPKWEAIWGVGKKLRIRRKEAVLLQRVRRLDYLGWAGARRRASTHQKNG
jgi:hypothetical protein